MPRSAPTRGRLSVLIVLLVSGCRTRDLPVPFVDSPVVRFEEVFEFADTIRLDSSILVGRIAYLDVNESGELLVTDDISRDVYRFDSMGAWQQTYSVPACLPDDIDFRPWSARFVGGGRVLAMQIAGPAAVFNSDGACVAGTRLWDQLATSFCASGDSVFTHRIFVQGQAKAGVFLTDLRALDAVPISAPRLPSLNMDWLGRPGQSMACFSDGAYYIYAESMDAISVRPRPGRVRSRPEFFERRPRDLPRGSREERRRLRDEYPLTNAVLALNDSIRIVVHDGLDERWRLREGRRRVTGISITSNRGHVAPRSMVPPVSPKAAGNGFIYVIGENEVLPSGEVGNPVIIRYQFKAPQSSHG